MFKTARFCVVCALCCGFNAQLVSAQPAAPGNSLTKSVQPTSISAPGYRARLQSALREVNALEPRPPRPLGKIVGKLDQAFAVRRVDGRVQGVDGDFWSNFARRLSKPKDASRRDVRRAQSALQAQIRALDEWQNAPNYRNADAQTIITGLESSGQIRVGPLAWQKALSDAWGAVARVWAAFWKWVNGLLPTSKTSNVKAKSSDKWLWFLFYGVVAALLAAITWFLWRVFGGKWGARRVKVAADLQGEDADLLRLPPEELLSRAAQFAAQGNFREALRHRYLSLLIDLDARGAWRYDARRTNWEHIANLRRGDFNRDLIAPLSALTRRFDRVRYGGAPCDDESWRHFDAEARDFETRAASRSASATRNTEAVR